VSTLEFKNVTAGVRRDAGVLRNVTFEVDAGELVAVWGVRRSGKSTLLRVAAGLVKPTAGEVLLDGAPVRDRTPHTGWFDQTLSSYQAGSVAEHVAVPLLPRGVPGKLAVARATATLKRVGIGDLARANPGDLKPAELVRAGIARALVARPLLLIADEPTATVGLLDVDPIFELLRSITDEGAAVLVTIGEAADAPRSDRMLTLGGGLLRGETIPSVADVVPLAR